MNGVLGWFGRVVVTVLSLLATFSIIGSIAAIPSGSVGGGLGIDRPPPHAPAPPALEEPAVRSAPARGTDGPPAPNPDAGGSQLVETIAMPPERETLLRWLEPLTYGVIALAGLMALAVLLLWRIVAALDARR